MVAERDTPAWQWTSTPCPLWYASSGDKNNKTGELYLLNSRGKNWLRATCWPAVIKYPAMRTYNTCHYYLLNKEWSQFTCSYFHSRLHETSLTLLNCEFTRSPKIHFIPRATFFDQFKTKVQPFNKKKKIMSEGESSTAWAAWAGSGMKCTDSNTTVSAKEIN